jgi:hypothetical protein
MGKMRLLPRAEQERYQSELVSCFTYTGLRASKLIAIILVLGQFFSMLDAWKREENK